MTIEPFPNPLTRATVQSFVEQFFWPDYVATLNRARQTRYREVLDRYILPAIGTVRFMDVNGGRIQRLVNEEVAAGCSPLTAHRIRNTVSDIFNDATRRGWIIGRSWTHGVYVPPLRRGRRGLPRSGSRV